MNFKRVLNILIFLAIIMGTFGCLTSYATDDIALQKKKTQEKINKIRWLEGVEQNKLYKNQQKLETATNNLSSSKAEIADMQKKLNQLQSQLSTASSEYNTLNNLLAAHLRNAYKSQRNARFQIILNSDDINMLVDRCYYQRLILQQDEARMLAARNKAQEIASIKGDIASRKRRLERSVASMNTQQDYIKRAIARNENMLQKLKTDRIAYQKAEKELEHQSQQLSNYINKTANKSPDIVVATGFMKPIQGRITSPFGWRTHPIFNTRTFHSGIDIGGPNQGAIKASNSGKVIYTGWYGGYGKVVILEHGVIHGKPITTLYAHMSSIAVANGAKVQRGQVLGYEGTTGYSTGPHCHFEVRVNGQPNNPLTYIQGT